MMLLAGCQNSKNEPVPQEKENVASHNFRENKTNIYELLFMKKITLIFTFLLLPFLVMAQKEISLAVNNTSTGDNISLKYGVYLSPKNQVEFGVKYHINPMYINPTGSIFSRNIRTQNKWQHWGLDGTFYRDISKETFKTRVRLFYNMQYTYASFRQGSELSKPAHFIENNIGLNLKAPITERIFVNLSGGAGVVLIRNYSMFIGDKRNTWQFSRFLSFGVVYRLK